MVVRAVPGERGRMATQMAEPALVILLLVAVAVAVRAVQMALVAPDRGLMELAQGDLATPQLLHHSADMAAVARAIETGSPAAQVSALVPAKAPAAAAAANRTLL